MTRKSAATILAEIGFAHRPGTGYRPELDPYQSYVNAARPRFAAVAAQLRAAGYYQTRAPFRVMGGRYAACFERSAAYAVDRLDVDTMDGLRVDRITHYCGRSND